MLEVIEILYITLAIFTAVIGTLLAVLLYKVIKILGPIMEILGGYKKAKAYLAAYSQVPNIVKERVFDLIKKDK